MARRFPNRALSILILIAGISSNARAQTSAGSCSEVHVYASVLNRNKQVVAGLAPQDFSAQLDGKAATIKEVQHEIARHRVLILIDHSASMRSVWPAILEATVQMLQQLPDSVPISVTVFDEQVRELVPVTQDHKAAITSVKQFFFASAPTKRTRLYDALNQVLTRIGPSRTGDVIYVLTDGGDNASDVRSEKIKQRLASLRTRMFGVIISPEAPSTVQELDGQRDLRGIVQQTGGTYLNFHAQGGEHGFTNKQISEIPAQTRWLVQNMIDDYDVILDPAQPLSSRAKVKLQVSMPGLQDPKDNKFEVITQPTIATGCQ